MSGNPFTVSSPETMNASEMMRLFVPLAENFAIDSPGHAFIHGHRGCGKSMMLRQLAPDCLMLSNKSPISELPYLGLYATIKSTELDISDFERISNQYAGLVLAEHSLTLFVASKALQSLSEHTADCLNYRAAKDEIGNFCEEFVIRRLTSAGPGLTEEQLASCKSDTTKDVLARAIKAIDLVYDLLSTYLRKIGISDGYTPYTGPLLGYRDFLFPILSELTKLECLPKNKPVFMVLDDADNLGVIQTMILNNWVSFRTGNRVSFKISTQRSYKTWRTTTKQRIEAPHDFKEVDISTIYTGKHSKTAYPKWVSDVITKRLAEHNILISAKDFFPPDQKQETVIQRIAEQHRKNWESSGKGFRPGDDAYRYARPDYIKSLGPKQIRTYSYAGFDQLVHISSGIVRHFLDNAASMYAELVKLKLTNDSGVSLDFIPPPIQDEVVRESADDLFFRSLTRLEDDAKLTAENSTAFRFKQLRNLINTLGGIFHKILVSDRSERRVFSIALSDSPSDDVMSVIKLGVRHGYLYEAAIGTKEGLWRTPRFVLTRRLAPLFKLDPTGFSGYLFVTSNFLELAIRYPNKAISDFENNRLGTDVQEVQLPLELDS